MTTPSVSIGLPVYNGERFLPQSIESLLCQDHEDLELVISDNGSTDGTEEICRSYAAADGRVRYERHRVNRGAAWNFCRVADLADPGATFIKWAAADDEHAPDYLSTTVALLEDDPSAALAHTGTADIDEDGYVLRVRNQPVECLASFDPAERMRDLVTLRHECFGAFGLIRHGVERATRGLGAYSDADNVLLVEIALRGRMRYDDRTLFFRRQHPDRSITAYPDARTRGEWFDSGLTDVLPFPTWRVGWELRRAVRDAPLSAAERRRCYAALEVFAHDNWQGLVKDLVRSGVEAPGVLARRWQRRRAPRPASAPTPLPVVALTPTPTPTPAAASAAHAG